jgi:exosortase family protein XrtM
MSTPVSPAPSASAEPASNARPFWFLVAFAAAYVVGHVGYYAIPDQVLREVVIHFGVVVPSAGAIDLLAPAERVVAQGHTLVSPRATLEVVRGCDGIGTALLLAAAIVAFPGAWSRKLTGLALGLALVYVVNLVRIVVLYFVVAYRGDWFQFLHTYLVPVAFVALVAVFFAWWAARAAGAVAPGAAVP